MTIWALIGVIIIYLIAARILSRRERIYIDGLNLLARRVIENSQNIEKELKQRLGQIHTSKGVSKLNSLIQVAQTVVYTKRTINTYYDPERQITIAYEGPIQFVAASTGMENLSKFEAWLDAVIVQKQRELSQNKPEVYNLTLEMLVANQGEPKNAASYPQF